MKRALQILTLVLLLISLLGNAWQLWAMGNVAAEVRQLQAQLERQRQELNQVQEERDDLRDQVVSLEEQQSLLEQEKRQLEEERQRLEEELAAAQGRQDWLEKVDLMESNARSVRRQVPPRPVERLFVSLEEIAVYREGARALSYRQERADRDVQVFSMLGLLSSGTDLHGLLLGLHANQNYAFYDLARGRLYLVGETEPSSQEQLVFVHEYVLALQDQLFDLRAQVAAVVEDSDRLLALWALSEGDATLAMELYREAYAEELGPARVFTQTVQAVIGPLRGLPSLVLERVLFPYQAGRAFVDSLYATRGWAGVDEGWGDPPQSTEQILHPERFPDDAPEVVTLPALTSTLGAGWRFQQEDTLGEFMLRQHLSLYLDEEEVDDAATGWGGDRYALYVNSQRGTACLLILLDWDDEEEADEFAEMYQDYAKERYKREGEGDLDEGIWWSGQPGLLMRQRRDEIHLVLAWDQELAVDVVRRLR